ncbi:MAG: hypothetical protein R3C45_10960 [Phycisphaerales bacterium]
MVTDEIDVAIQRGIEECLLGVFGIVPVVVIGELKTVGIIVRVRIGSDGVNHVQRLLVIDNRGAQ